MDPYTDRTDAGTHVVIFDHRDIHDGSMGLRERVAACFRTAKLHTWHVVEVCDSDQGTLSDELDRALEICEHIGARLLVYTGAWRGQSPGFEDRLIAVGLITAQPEAVS